MNNLFESVKNNVSTVEAAQHYGYKVEKRGRLYWARCPFHDERTSSFAIYEDDGWICYGCGASGGDVISFVSRLFNVRPLPAAKKINLDFGLGINVGQSLSSVEREQLRQAKIDRARVAEFEAWAHWACDVLAFYLRILDYARLHFAPRTTDDDLTPLFVEACYNTDYYDYVYTQTFIFGGFDEQVDLYKTHAGRLDIIARRFNMQNYGA